MTRPTVPVAFLSFIVYVLLDWGLHALALWLGTAGLGPTAELLMRIPAELLAFVPLLAAGLTAGYLAAPRGFPIAFVAALAGAWVSFLWTYDGMIGEILGSADNLLSVITRSFAVAVAAGVAAWGGERCRGPD